MWQSRGASLSGRRNRQKTLLSEKLNKNSQIGLRFKKERKLCKENRKLKSRSSLLKRKLRAKFRVYSQLMKQRVLKSRIKFLS